MNDVVRPPDGVSYQVSAQMRMPDSGLGEFHIGQALKHATMAVCA